MATLPTARGDEIDVADLGLTLMHEHIFGLSPEINANYPETWGDEQQRIASAIEELRAAKAAGVGTIVDVTVLGLGRYVPRIKQIAEAVPDINIVVATGLYTFNELPMFFTFRGPGSPWEEPETLDDLFVRDIEEGIAGTGVRAGIIKCATGHLGLTDGVERVLRACARAHRRTGVPITTHTLHIPNGADQQRVFEEEGVDLTRVVIGHVEAAATVALDYVVGLLDRGSCVGFDRFGLETPVISETGVEMRSPEASDVDRMNLITELCDRGYAEQIVLSHDRMCFCDSVPSSWYGEPSTVPDWQFTTVPQKVLPGLRERGVSAEQIDQMTRTNAMRLFGAAADGGYS